MIPVNDHIGRPCRRQTNHPNISRCRQSQTPRNGADSPQMLLYRKQNSLLLSCKTYSNEGCYFLIGCGKAGQGGRALGSAQEFAPHRWGSTTPGGRDYACTQNSRTGGHMLLYRGRLFDLGSFLLAIGGALALAIAGAQLIALAYINNKWPPAPLQQLQDEAVQRSSTALNRLDGPNVLLQVNSSEIQRWLDPELQKAVGKLNETRPDLHLQVDTVQVSFEGQRGSISGAFELHVAKPDLTVAGTIEGFTYLSLDGRTLSVRPALGKLRLKSVHSDSQQSWWLPPAIDALYAELLLVRDNINGLLPTYTAQLQVAPVTLPGEPRGNVPITFPDPFHPGSTLSETFVPPVLKGAALLADSDRLTVLGQLSVKDVPAPAPGGTGTDDFLVFRREFRSRLKASGLVADPASGISFDVAASFINDLFRQSIGQVFTRDRVSAAVQASYDALPKLTHPDVGVSLDTRTVSKVVEDRIRTTLDAWAAKQSATVSGTKFEVRPQYFWAGTSAAFNVSGAGAKVEASVAVAVPAAGTAAGIRLYPAIDQLSLTKLTADSYGDLTGLLRGVNTFLAGAIGAANAALKPVDVGLDPLKLGTVDFRSMVTAPGITVSPQTYTPPAIAVSNTALLLDENRIMVMAEANPVASAAQAAKPPVDFDAYRRAYLARWSEPFGDPALPGVARAYVRTSAVARYVNTAFNDAHLAMAAAISTDSTSPTPLDIGEIPRVKCKDLLHCPSCHWWNAVWCVPEKIACEVFNKSVTLACEVALPPVRLAINEMTHILGRHLGDLDTEARGAANIQARDFRINLADDFTSIAVNTTVAADATASADLRFHSKSVSGVLVCPLDFHHHVPFPSGDIHAQIPAQDLGLRSSIQTSLEPVPGGGGQRFAMVITPQDDIDVKGNLDTQPYLQLRLVMLSMNVQCPVTNVINVMVPVTCPRF